MTTPPAPQPTTPADSAPPSRSVTRCSPGGGRGSRTGGVVGRRAGRRTTPLALGLAGCLLLTGCGAQVQKDASAGAEKTIENCGQRSTYPTPQKPVAYDVSAIEKMFSLGLAEQMRGIVLPQTVSSVVEKSPYRDDYGKVETISDTVLGQEAVVSARADWVFAGWQAGFSETRGVTPDSLRDVGINSYMQHETCRGYKGDTSDPDPLAATEQDLTDLGTIFGAEDRAEKLVGQLREKRRALEESPRPAKPARVFVYDSGTSEPYTAGRRTALNGMIHLAGAESVTKDLDARWDTVGWESVVTSVPEAVVVVDYNKQPVQEKIDYLRNRSPIKDSPAVKNGRIYVMDYGEAVSSPRNMDGAQKLADYLRSEGLR
ncbi:ABC transporter substrate-binding protein [Kocuria sp.]|uniref:ABC transporter substrate-binding protein n=1 Tax=Kocuria sp. TaxID=1871328 RepID=UPI0026DC74B5|nr:ABC transporter substrate-binding protein [Kocuria sp.]MDO4919597.1 ABC transporter substrate-binding protein [Kocuria sp.]